LTKDKIKMMNKKRGISELIAYVLLVSLAIGLSSAVYTWMRAYAINNPSESCPDGVSLIIQDYSCNATDISLNLSNKGLFRVDGYIFRINNETDESGSKPKGLPVNVIETVLLSTPLNPGEISGKTWPYKKKYGRIVEMEIEPLRLSGKRNILCEKAVIRQKTTMLECN
jgi:hypothetical protein